MDYRTTLFYVAALIAVGCVVELYVRARGIGAHVEKVRGTFVPSPPKLARPVVLMVVALIITAITFPR
ncbi:MAG: hypothetical protein D4R84_07885 [Rhodocyclaceae bacterium]|nr:MAG: hypothetical protein D4R84_07885 [Rhodocyclaceae bacterium]